MDPFQMDVLDKNTLTDREKRIIEFFDGFGYAAVGTRPIAPGLVERGVDRDLVFERKKPLSFETWMETGSTFDWGVTTSVKASRACGFAVHVWYWITADNFVTASPLFKEGV